MNPAGKVLSYELFYRVSVDVQAPDGKERLPREEIELVQGFCGRATPDTALLIVARKLDRKDLKTKWVQEVDRVGVLVQVWPLEGQRLVGWLE